MDRNIDERHHAGDGDRARRRNVPQPQQRRERSKHQSRGGEGEIADQAVRADGCERIAPDHRKAGDDHCRACRAPRRKPFLEHERCQRETAERGTGGLDHPAMGERHEEEPRITQERERRAAEQR